MKLYTKKLAHRAYIVTIKLDGVQGICNAGVWTSRNGKPLYNLPVLEDGKLRHPRFIQLRPDK